jgi:hypothetical protein
MSHKVCPSLLLTVHPGAEPWAPDQRALDRLACELSNDVRIDLYPRSALPALWERDYGESYALDSHAFRGWSDARHVTLLADETETPDSIAWLLAHELAHIELGRTPSLREHYRSIPKPIGYLSSDSAHEAWPEEGLANEMADDLMRELELVPGRDRFWWRRRVLTMRGG